jgi:flagellar FliL protein
MAEEDLFPEGEIDEEIPSLTEGAPPQKSRLLRIIFGLVSIVVFIVLMIVVAQWIFQSRSRLETPDTSHQYKQKKVPKQLPLKTLKLDSFRFNLSDPDGNNGIFFQLEIALGYPEGNPELDLELQNRNYQIKDKIIALISQKTYENIKTTEQVEKLKEEIKTLINSILIQGKVEKIFLIEFNVVPRT